MAGWNFGGCAGMNIGNTEMPEPILSVSICPFLSHRIRTLCFHNHNITSSSICLSLGWQTFCFVRTHNHYYRSSCFGFIFWLVVVRFAVHWYLLPYYEYAIEPPTSFRSLFFHAEMLIWCVLFSQALSSNRNFRYPLWDNLAWHICYNWSCAPSGQLTFHCIDAA